VLKTHSRPYTSTDNPYSEAHFKTLKYRPEFPDRTGGRESAVNAGVGGMVGSHGPSRGHTKGASVRLAPHRGRSIAPPVV
jgi:hypothetical protein